jgi:hypothetical protein
VWLLSCFVSYEALATVAIDALVMLLLTDIVR